jgi:hypothetical protein
MDLDKRTLSAWLKTIDPKKRWAVNDLPKLEQQLVANIKECGYLNLKGLISAVSQPAAWDEGVTFGGTLREQLLEEARNLPKDAIYREEWSAGVDAVLDGVTSWVLKTVKKEEGGF